MTLYTIYVTSVLLFVAIILMITTVGCVLLVRLSGLPFSPQSRTFVAAFSGSLLLALPIIATALFDDHFVGWGMFFAVVVSIWFVCMIVAWLPAHFATKHLDRLIRFEVETFS